MQPLPILTYPDPILTAPAKKVAAFTPALSRLIDQMVETMRVANGVGLAAPQIGQQLQITVIEHRPSGRDDEPAVPLQVLVNPKIISTSKEKETEEEGCLSLPGLLVPVPRARRIKVRAQDAQGTVIQFRASGFHARIIQHELDHLRGRLIIDYAQNKHQLVVGYKPRQQKKPSIHDDQEL